MSDPTDVQEYIQRENQRRGRSPENEGEEDGGDDPEGEGEEKSHNQRLKESILEG